MELELKTYVISLIRTVTPVVVGNFVGWLATLGLVLPPESAESLTGLIMLTTGAVFTIAYYAIVRRLEMRWPAVGILLGRASAPVAYSHEPKNAAAQIDKNAIVADHVRQARATRKAAHRLDTTAIPVVAVRDGEG